jgi:hypothetical protein
MRGSFRDLSDVWQWLVVGVVENKRKVSVRSGISWGHMNMWLRTTNQYRDGTGLAGLLCPLVHTIPTSAPDRPLLNLIALVVQTLLGFMQSMKLNTQHCKGNVK